LKPGAECTRKRDGREQRLVAGSFVVEVNGDQNILYKFAALPTVSRPAPCSLSSSAAVSIYSTCRITALVELVLGGVTDRRF
jgi:hypothetical protein